ncbi:MAG: hypothetical protein V1744_08580 [Candidatus Altiarchaeota archaeon]
MVNKKKGKGGRKSQKKVVAKKPNARKVPASRKPVKAATKGKRILKVSGKKIKCCQHCPDFEYCEDKGICCDYCDFYLNGKCTYGKKKGIPSTNQQVELPDYRGDDYGIDDYEAYEPVYE